MKQVIRIIGGMSDIASGQFSAWLVFILMCIILVEVFTRYILRSPLMIADEVGAYIFVGITFIGLAYTWKEKGHIRIEVFVTRLPTKVRNWLRLITLVIATAFVPVLIKASYELVAYSHSRGVRSDTSLRTIMEWPQMALIIGSVFLLFPTIVELVKVIRTIRTSGAEVE